VIRIRAAKRGDTKAIGRIQVDTWRDAYAGLLPDKVLLRMSAEIEGGRWIRVIERKEAVVVAEDSKAGVVGFGSCGPSRLGALPFEGEVYTLYVAPGFQGKGIGRRLLRSLFVELELAGMKSALIWVLKANQSRFFYEAMGGRHVADRDERLWGSVVAESGYGWNELAVPCSRR
jgi:ribosomal protein S18 acetylase RimI-like enzyme